MEEKNYYHIDCFSGPGGICTGFKAAGLKTLLAIEKVSSCAETYLANHAEVTLLNKDIRSVTESEVLNAIGDKKISILTSGMPCETFSTAGSKSRSSYDYRQQLYSEAIRIAKVANAEMILFENVPAITTKHVEKGKKRLVLQEIKLELIQHGYPYFIEIVLDASRYGVPQNRKRYFLLAAKNKNVNLRFPEPLSDSFTTTVMDAFESLPDVEANEDTEVFGKRSFKNPYTMILNDKDFWKIENQINGQLTYHKAPKHRQGTLERFKLIESGENLKSLFDKLSEDEKLELQAQKVLPKKWYIQRNYRLPVDKPSKTITSHCLDELIHPVKDRCLTVREVARLQSFPDFYDFKGGPYICPHIYETQDKYEQIGDAVPPLLAYHWGRTIIQIIEEFNGEL